ncbi:hypothetical protein LEP1GSC103_2776 [Leptospira borgpetersenii serovar Javanica str. UI 09931]|uniref:Uncharacterized protein n=3 Tax=Leptospira borgpetersenii TaxID=174 RepID=A0A0S2IMD4_LEPBO|nr:hypothetical protein LBBP_00296 [Leptospira borgpetersenii serovar Ballum]EKQ92122.1 hypothetical protein LEP1GSC101_3119 [Leptospira borgpetersenii str. UI 09149]EKQ98828.1 hypothetical protein LEP1GSC121_0560 [Leptospira borgpetersenii serovar Castellonis str. 200801910]EMN11707.1 hypothetical protein LEP1GSC055_3973 [Leptospira borgpetersenii str. Brem 307]EMN19390.1 hypothetical protein LEP1GSC056_3036 [Leptospira borgpetersenii str. Brem 328]EMN59362.1 hypothetical protein LEP1GSC090_1
MNKVKFTLNIMREKNKVYFKEIKNWNLEANEEFKIYERCERLFFS